MQQFVDRMDEFLEALLSREAMPEHATFVTNQLRFGDVGNASHPP